MTDYIHGTSDPREVARLERQARFFSQVTFGTLDLQPGHRVLDLATGVGAVAGELLREFPGVHLVGLDLRRSQLGWARKNHPQAAYVQADATRMPFADDTFDRLHCSWLLEHVRKPVDVLREVRRVLRPGGWVQFIEVDNATFEMSPRDDDVAEVIDALNAAQARVGGDPFIGPRLPGYFAQAGFAEVDARPLDMHASGKDPGFFAGFAEEWAEIFESLDEVLPDRRTQLARAAARLRAFPSQPGAWMHYRPWLARARK